MKFSIHLLLLFFHHLADGARFSALSDLSDSSSNPFSNHAGNFPIVPVLLNNERYFLLSIDEPSRDWCLALCDPISVLQIFHQGWHVDPLLLVMRLLSCGVALNTFFTRLQDEPPPLASPLSRVPVQLDWRTTNYDTYELARNIFLSRPYACAALLKGGIVRCLAREHLDIVPAAGGPSQDMFTFGTPLHSTNGCLFWDDDIDGSEMDFICGVYKLPLVRACKPLICLGGQSNQLGWARTLTLAIGHLTMKFGFVPIWKKFEQVKCSPKVPVVGPMHSRNINLRRKL